MSVQFLIISLNHQGVISIFSRWRCPVCQSARWVRWTSVRLFLCDRSYTGGPTDLVQPSRCILSGLWFRSCWLRVPGMTQRPLWPGTAARAAASGFQSRRRQLFWGSMRCPASKDLAVGATGVSPWQLGWWPHGSSPMECLGVAFFFFCPGWFSFSPLLLKLA